MCTTILKDGGKWVAAYVNGNRHGQCVTTHSNDKEEIHNFINGRMVVKKNKKQ